jgi:SAM-dependent methyltransferase
MDGELWARRASSFGAEAAAYAEHRPDYPEAGIRWVMAGADLPVAGVLDLAAGTGKLTGGLLGLGFAVTAVEPDEGMRAELTRHFPSVTGLAGTAEEIPLPDGSVDAVVAGQAFHWFDHDRALTEIARVLRPGGVVGALWNRDDVTVDWVLELNEVASSSVSMKHDTDVVAEHPAFHPFEEKTFPHAHLRTAESLTRTIGTHSHTLVVSPDEREEVLGRVYAYLMSRQETSNGPFELPINTTILRARRR